MISKTNKSFTKRLKLTKNGKILAKKPGKNHFNARKRRLRELEQKQWRPFAMKQKDRSRFLPS